MHRVLLYWHTLRHLHASQFTSRLRFRLIRPRLRRNGLPRPRRAPLFTVPHAEPAPSMTGPTRFRLLNVEGECTRAADWNDPSVPRLWLYNLHYFDDLSAAGASARAGWHRDLIARWIAENPPAAGTGWEPYPTSLRVVNWIRWRAHGNDGPPGMDASLALQARWLRRRVEWHLLGNHVLANAKALALAGLYFEGDEADGWRRFGFRTFRQQLEAQLLTDGGHAERSPMYHALLLEDVLDLLAAADASPRLVPEETCAALRAAAARMLGWLNSLTHPDGTLALLNDAAFDIAPEPAALARYADRLGIAPAGGTTADGSGYVRAELGDAVLIVDVGAVGPDEQPGHAHADTLSFELSLHGRRVIVDTGTSTYASGPQRAFERSTAAHNTVEIDGADSSEVWHGFRVARRARIRERHVAVHAGQVSIRAAHDGYTRLPGRPVHAREWSLSQHSLTVTDTVSGGFRRAVGRLLLHPSVRPREDGTLHLADGRTCRLSVEGARLQLVPAEWSPRFGAREATQRLECTLSGPAARFELSWGQE